MKKKTILFSLITFFSFILLLDIIRIPNLLYPVHQDIPGKCFLKSGLSCDDAQVTSRDIKMRFTNLLGEDLRNVNLSFNKCQDEDGIAFGPKELRNGESGAYTITCKKPMIGERIKINLHLNYIFASNDISHSVSGLLMQRTQDPVIPSFFDIFSRYFPHLMFFGPLAAIIVLSMMLHKENLKLKKIK